MNRYKDDWVTLTHKYLGKYEEELEWEYEIRTKDFLKNEKVINFFEKNFCDFYGVTKKQARDIMEDYDMYWDENLLKEVLDFYMEELDEIFWDDEYWY